MTFVRCPRVVLLSGCLGLGSACVEPIDPEEGTEATGTGGSSGVDSSGGASETTSVDSTGAPDESSSGESTGDPDPPPDGGLGPWGFGYVEHPELEIRWIGFGDFEAGPALDAFIKDADGEGVSLVGDGAGGFTSVDVTSLPGGSDLVRVGDFDGSGTPDVAVFDEYHNEAFSVLLNQGMGDFLAPDTVTIEGFFGFGVIPLRLDDDADHDLFVPAGHSEGALLALAQGDGTFVAGPVVEIVGCYLSATAVGDVSGDGLDDVVTTGSCNSVPEFLPLTVYHNTGGMLEMTQAISADLGPVIEGGDIRLLDVDGDGDLDIVTPTDLGIYVLHNQGDGTYADPPLMLPHEFAGYTQRMMPIHLDASGSLGFVLETFDFPPAYTAALVIPNDDWTALTTEPLDLQGRLAGTADVNGDGAPDIAVLVGDPASDVGALGLWLSGG